MRRWLQTVSELRADLQKTTMKITQLQSDNDELQTKYGGAREELSELKKKFNEARESYMAAVTEKFEAEREHDALIEMLKNQLSEKTREFDRIREDLIPHDIDQLRIKVQEELEIRHKQELKAMEAELEQQRERNFAVRRELERVKAEYNSLVQNQQTEISSLRSEKDELMEAVRVEATKVRQVDNSGIKDEKIRSLTSKVGELSHLVELLREELKTARHDKDAVASNLETTRAKLESLQTTMKTKLAGMESENQALKQRLVLVEADVDRKDSVIQSSKLTSEELTNRVEELLRENEANQRAFNLAKADLHHQLDLAQAAAEREEKDTHEQLDMLRGLVQDREESLLRVQRETSEMQLRAEGIERELRRSHLSQIQEIRRKMTSNELELADATQTIRTQQDQLLSLQEQWTVERDGLVSESHRLKREKDILHSKLREGENVLDAARKKASLSQQELSAKLSLAEKKGRDASLQIGQLESRLAAMTGKVSELERGRQQARESYDQLEQRYSALLLQVDAMKSDFQRQLQSVAPSVKDRMDVLQRQMKLALSKERKRADRYKSKALEAHYRIKALGEANQGGV